MSTKDILSSAGGAIIGLLAFVAGSCGGTEQAIEGEGPQLRPLSGAFERAHFDSLHEAYAHADLVVVAVPAPFEASATFTSSGGRNYGEAQSALRVDQVLKGEPSERVLLAMPSGEEHDDLGLLDDALAGRKGVYFLMSTEALVERKEIVPSAGEPDVYILANTGAALLDGGPRGVYPLYADEPEPHPFAGEFAGGPFDELIAAVDALE